MSTFARGLICLFVLLAVPGSAVADTGQLREVAEGDGLRLLVFTSPTPFRAGEVEVSVVATGSDDGAPLGAFDLLVRARRADWSDSRPSLVIGGAPDPADAFMRKAVFQLDEPGPWSFRVEVTSGDRELAVPLEITVADPLPGWRQLLPLILIGVPIAGLVVVRDALVRLRAGRARRSASISDPA